MEPNVVVRVVQLNLADNSWLTIWQRFLEVVNKLGVTVVNSTYHVFPGGGFTGLVLIAESHAAIHTWPEKNYAWCELATCGDPQVCNVFEAELKKALE